MKRKLLAAGGVVLALLVSVLLLYTAWVLEESKKSIRTVVVENPKGDDIFIVELQEKEGEHYIIQCNEERYQEAFRHFAKFVGVDTEPLTAPGGPKLLALPLAELPQNLEPAKRALVEFLKRHSPRRVILLAHSECLLYDTIAAWQDRLEEVRARQIEDIRRVRYNIKTWFPKAKVEMFYAEMDGKRLRFNPLTKEE